MAAHTASSDVCVPVPVCIGAGGSACVSQVGCNMRIMNNEYFIKVATTSQDL